jgi:hypothetical protein
MQKSEILFIIFFELLQSFDKAKLSGTIILLSFKIISIISNG